MDVTTDEGPVLVTGAARRIGRAIAERFAQLGRPVVLHASHRSLAEAEAAVDTIRRRGGRAAAVAGDLAEVRDCEGLIAAAARAFGPVTLLVNNASLFESDHADDFSVELFDRHIAVNLRAPAILTRDLAAQLPEGAEGAVVHVIDQRVWKLTPQYFSYTLTKAALWTATRTMAQTFAPRLRVNAVGPGPVLPNKMAGEAGFETEARNVPLHRAVDVAGVVDAVVYLASARAVTGQMIAVDSGQHLAWETPDVVPE